MDRIYRCDRCGKAVEREPELIAITTKNDKQMYGVVVAGCESEGYARDEYAYEYREELRFCDTCQKELGDFLTACKPPKKQPKPCPFCGEVPYVYARLKTPNTNYYQGIVGCQECQLVYSASSVQPTPEKAIDEAISHWNSRKEKNQV